VSEVRGSSCGGGVVPEKQTGRGCHAGELLGAGRSDAWPFGWIGWGSGEERCS
jgi:hypothetical protein